MNVDGLGQRQLTSGPGSCNLDVSPDDRRIVFTSSRGGPAEIFMMNANGSGQTQLSFVPDEVEDRPVFSPDGMKIAFDNSPAMGDDVFAANADGSGRMPLTANDDAEDDPDWQPIPVNCSKKMSTLVGTEGTDKLVGTTGADVISGLAGKTRSRA